MDCDQIDELYEARIYVCVCVCVCACARENGGHVVDEMLCPEEERKQAGKQVLLILILILIFILVFILVRR